MTSNTARRQKAAAGRAGPGAAAPSPTVADMWQVRRSDGSVATGWILLPLRLFLGVTFLFAGLQKLANPAFFRASAPGSIHAQMVGAAHTSPIGPILGHLVGASSAIGVLIALAEVAVGVGALLGLLTRVAAVGGALVAFSLFLAISFHTSPYYTGSDIVFVFAWTPLVLAGAAGAPALDTWLATREAGPAGTGAGSGDDVVSRGAVIGMVAGGTAVLVAAIAGIGRALAPSSSSSSSAATLPAPTTTVPATTTTATGGTGASSTTTTGAVPKGTAIGAASSVPVGGSAAFNDPSTGDPSLVIQHRSDQFVAFDAICPHAGCTVAYQSGSDIIACPCHGSEFNPRTGAVLRGPATNGLTPIKVVKGANGNLYVV